MLSQHCTLSIPDLQKYWQKNTIARIYTKVQVTIYLWYWTNSDSAIQFRNGFHMITGWNVPHVQTIMIVWKTTGTWWQILQQLQVWMSTGNHSNKIPSWAINMTTGDKATKHLVIQSWWGVITLLQNLLKLDCKKMSSHLFLLYFLESFPPQLKTRNLDV